jgi:hypothetical protein
VARSRLHDFRDSLDLGHVGGGCQAEELTHLFFELVVGNVEASTSHPGNEELIALVIHNPTVERSLTMKKVITKTVIITAEIM